MKKLLLLFLLGCSSYLIAQVTNEGTPASWSLTEKSGLEAISLPQIDIKKIKTEDDINDKIQSKPYRVGISHKVNYGLDNSGTWTQLENGDRIWRILFSSKDAVHLSVNFDNTSLPNGASIYLYNDDRSDLLGAYTHTSNNKEQKFGTWFVKGDKLWVEYFEPKEVKGQGKLNISSVIHGYRLGYSYQKGYFKEFQKLNQSGDCNHDVDCPIGADFEAQKDLLKKSVGFLNMGDGFICSGNLLNNTAEDKTPYFLSANHCYERNPGTANPALFSMRFNWISPVTICGAVGNSTDASENLTTTGGAEFKARYVTGDMLLVELNNPIDPTWDVTYAGWDRTDDTPNFVVGIHHPAGDIMKISRDDSPVVKSSVTIAGQTSQVWTLNSGGGDWEIGVTEGGSSGSALFDQNGRVIGQLFGAQIAADVCDGTDDFAGTTYYGRFAVSWTGGGSPSLRLKTWLDPNGVGGDPNTLNSLENVLAVNDEVLEQNISIFPNPTSGFVQIKIREWVSDYQYEVYNVLGQTLKFNELQNNEILDLSDLPSDIYFMKITEIETNKILIKKIVLNK
jgi:hypothetical protein